MMARVFIRKPEIPCFVLNSQVRVADWEQVCGTHQGQRQTSTPRSKAGHRTVLTNRAINAFYPCNADAIHTGQSCQLQGLIEIGLVREAPQPLAHAVGFPRFEVKEETERIASRPDE